MDGRINRQYAILHLAPFTETLPGNKNAPVFMHLPRPVHVLHELPLVESPFGMIDGHV